ncbi:MAG: hypothetical protein PHR30_07315 [Gallionellaceae bacterium]|nr:hypothetical protein [Gallionellaceae bacterium]MDD5365133.1 hypothetical protein [Gallionellaceae bacterium]
MTQTYSALPILLLGLLAGAVQAAEPATTAAPPNAAAPAPAPMPEAAPPVAPPAAKAAPTAKNGLAPAPETSLVDMVRALSQFLTEEEVQMVYDYLWDTSIATLKGSDEEITLPPELAFKLAILQKRIEKEGGHYLQGLSLKMEKDLAHWRESLNNPPPPPPYQLPSERDTPKQP